jgi:hypothetical protein
VSTSLVDNVRATSPHEGGSTQVQVGVSGSVIDESLTDPVERFLAMLRFEQRDKLAQLPVELTGELYRETV